MNTTRHPDELLVRFRHDPLTGTDQISGAHVRFLYRVTEGDTVVSEQTGPAQPVAIGGGEGFPLADILGAVEAGALNRMEAAIGERDTAVATMEAEKAADALLIAGLRAELATVEAARGTAEHDVTT